MKLRIYKADDCDALTELFYHTVHTINIKDYTKEQLNVWATGSVDLSAWNKSFLAHNTIVSEENDIIIGFGDMDGNGYLDRLYVHKDYQRKGIATAILNEFERQAIIKHITNFTTHASITAKPFFEKRGYKTLHDNTIVRNGVKLKNYLMSKSAPRSDLLIQKLTTLWQESVNASHFFVTACEIENLVPFVKIGLAQMPTLITQTQNSELAGFMGLDGAKIEMLFLSPKVFGQGIGKRLVNLAVNEYGIKYVDVNEQNPMAKDFYKHLGFEVYDRLPCDEQGNRFPILKMRIC